ncbi:glycosyltransferase [Candidatus Bathyarchaeota archaeon A05DMB-2]|nr:glycosyltransferase [Candidatus Bathyarchaeota archaeon A05DMB-2]
MPRTLVLIAALNEEEGIGCTLAELRQVLRNPAFLIVDGRSTDRTIQIAKEFGAEILLQEGTGKGNAIAQAFRYLDGDIDYLVLIDADYTYPAEYLPQMTEILEENPEVGMVSGNRFNGHLHLGEMHNILYFGNRLIAFTHNLLNGIELRDPLSGLRVVRWESIRNWTPKSKGFDVEVELNHQVKRNGYEIVEIPIHYRTRLGQKKLRVKHGLTIFKRILAESFK